MDIRKVKKLIEMLEESGVAEIEIREGEETIRINRGFPLSSLPSVASGTHAMHSNVVPANHMIPGAHTMQLIHGNAAHTSHIPFATHAALAAHAAYAQHSPTTGAAGSTLSHVGTTGGASCFNMANSGNMAADPLASSSGAGSANFAHSAQSNVSQTANNTSNAAAMADTTLHKTMSAGKTINSPMVGTFYSSPAPGEATFVKVGDKVALGDVLCIVEAMKMLNQIEAEVVGTIKAVLVENGQPVEFNQPLFVIE